MHRKTLSLLTVFLLAALLALPFLQAAPAQAAVKVGQVSKVTMTAKSVPDAVGIRYKWAKVSGASGYQLRIFGYWPDNKTLSEKKTTPKTAYTYYFQNNLGIRFRIRAYKKVNGKKYYGKWKTATLTEAQAYNLILGKTTKITK